MTSVEHAKAESGFGKFLSALKLNPKRRSSASADIDADLPFEELYKLCRPYTMTSKERMYGLYQAVRYVSQRGIRGDFVECGVWRGGSSILAALTFARSRDPRLCHLFDTFEGMPPPGHADVDFKGRTAEQLMPTGSRREVTYDVTCVASLADVRDNIVRAGCDPSQFRLVQGLVENTVSETSCGEIAILRLDTDWYQSTRHELEIFYPKLVPGGILIVDDYGHWRGARKAVDEYFAGRPILLNRLDYTARIAIKA